MTVSNLFFIFGINFDSTVVYYNNWKMRGSNLHREYYNDLSHSRYSSQTSRKLKSVASREDFNDTKTRFLNRIEKACTTLSTGDISKQIALYRKQIQRLQKQCLKKDKIIFEIKSTTALNKELEAELIETYRIIYMYEGKINQYEKELKRLEVTISKNGSGELIKKVEELLQSYRVDNSQLMGKVEESNRTIFQLQQKLKKVQNKYFDTAWKLSSTKREITNPLKKKFPNLRNTITIKQTPLLEKEKAFKLTMKTQENKQPDQYQIKQVKNKVIVDKEPIRFRRYQSKPQQRIQSQQVSRRLITNQQSTTNIKINAPHIQNNQLSLQTSKKDSPTKRESPITERKVYMSPITRYELNRKVQQVSNMMDGGMPHKHRYSISQQQNYSPKNIYY